MPTKKQPKFEPVTEPAPKKAVRKKVVKPIQPLETPKEPEAIAGVPIEVIEEISRQVAARVAEPVEVVPVLPVPEQHGEAVQPALPTIEPVIEQPAPSKLTLSQRWHNFKNSTWFWVTLAVFALIILWAVIAEIQRVKVNKVVKQTEKVETKITDEKGELSKTEANLSEMLNIKQKVDSLNIIIDSMQKLASDHAAYEETMHQLNLKYKLRNYELQNQIRTASDDSLRKIVSDLSKQK